MCSAAVYPDTVDGLVWESVECSSTDSNTNWGANGATPDPDWSHPNCHVNWFIASVSFLERLSFDFAHDCNCDPEN